MACRNSVSSMADDVSKILKLGIPCFPSIPSPILALGAIGRKGLNKKKIASDIISKLPSIGIPSGPDADGNQNIFEGLVALMVDVFVDAIVYDSKVSVAFKPGDMGMIQTTGANAGGPCVCLGSNVSFGGGNGIVT